MSQDEWAASSENLKLSEDVHSREAVRWGFMIFSKGKKHIRKSGPQHVQSFCAHLRFHLLLEQLHHSPPNLHLQDNLFYGLAVAPSSSSTLCYLYSVLHTMLFSWSLIPNLQLPYKEKDSAWHSHENVICCVHVCIYNNNGSSSSCSRKKIVARQRADHLAPDQNIWTISAVGLCVLDIPGSNITINSVNSIYRMSFVLVIQCKWYQNTARS